MRILLCLLLTMFLVMVLGGCSRKSESKSGSNDAQIQKAKESQAVAADAIKKLGGRVTFDNEKPGKPIVGVNFSDTKVTDAGLEQLKGLANLQILFLINTKVTDAGLVHLKGLTKLQSLYLLGTKVTAAGVKDLKAALPKCKITQ